MKTNYHTHTVWCDGKDTPESMIKAAIGKGFDVIGFSSHSSYPDDDACTVPAAKLPAASGKTPPICGNESPR